MNSGRLLVIIIFLLIFSADSLPQNIEEYQKHFAICKSIETQQLFIAIRKFCLADQMNYLVVNPNDLSTFIFREDEINVKDDSWDDILYRFNNTSYVKALHEAYDNADVIQDAGITHFSSLEQGANLTVDLCPSGKPLDRELFINLMNDFGKEEKPVPFAISVTGIWMKKHESDLNWLKDLINKKEISIIWINHTYNHKTSRTLPLKENFLLEKGTDLNFEVLQTEIKMIEEGIVPSPFFRFPGLVSDKEIFKKIIEFGLIPIGSDAWLAKNQWPKDGSIILLHANGNEPIGIFRFLKLLKDEKNNIRKDRWLLYDLRESIENFEDTLQIHK
jgi:hypothetical protein